jgi:hypothetical protein
MNNGKPAAPKPDTANRSTTDGASAKKRSSASKSAEGSTKKASPRTRRTATSKPTVDGATGLSAHERHALVAQAAYFRAAARGFAAGGELEDWVAAEAEIGAQLANV